MPTETKTYADKAHTYTGEHSRAHHANLCSIADRTRPIANLLRELLEDVRDLNEKVAKIETTPNLLTADGKAPLAEAKSAGAKVTQKAEICLKNINEIDALTDHLPENPDDPNGQPVKKIEPNTNPDGSSKYVTDSKRETREWQTKHNDDGSLRDPKDAEKVGKEWDAAHPQDPNAPVKGSKEWNEKYNPDGSLKKSK